MGNSLGLPGNPWDFLGIPGTSWESLESQGLRLPGNPRDLLGILGTLGVTGTSLESLGIPATSWESLGPQRIILQGSLILGDLRNLKVLAFISKAFRGEGDGSWWGKVELLAVLIGGKGV